MSHPRAATARALVGAVAVALLGACSAEPGGATVAPTVTPQPVHSAADIQLPLEDYRLDVASVRLLFEATRKLEGDCARRYGVQLTDPAGPDATTSITRVARRYGILSLQHAQSSGYRPSAQLLAQLTGETGGDAEWRPSDRDVLVLTGLDADGTPATAAERPRASDGELLTDGGCSAAAARALDKGLLPVSADLVEILEGQAFTAAEQDPVVVQAWRDWSACMRRSGHDYSSPWQPNDTDWGKTVTEQEIRTAVDDVQCRHQTGMTDKWVATEVSHQLRLISEHEDRLKRLRDYNRSRVARADDLLDPAQDPPARTTEPALQVQRGSARRLEEALH
jgi:hypothetical protein